MFLGAQELGQLGIERVDEGLVFLAEGIGAIAAHALPSITGSVKGSAFSRPLSLPALPIRSFTVSAVAA